MSSGIKRNDSFWLDSIFFIFLYALLSGLPKIQSASFLSASVLVFVQSLPALQWLGHQVQLWFQVILQILKWCSRLFFSDGKMPDLQLWYWFWFVDWWSWLFSTSWNPLCIRFSFLDTLSSRSKRAVNFAILIPPLLDSFLIDLAYILSTQIKEL